MGRSNCRIKSGDKVVDDVLQAKADADAEGAGDHGELIECHATGVHRKQENQKQKQVVQRGGDQLGDATLQVEAFKHLFAQQEAQRSGKREADQQDRPKTEYASQRDIAGAAGDVEVTRRKCGLAPRCARPSGRGWRQATLGCRPIASPVVPSDRCPRDAVAPPPVARPKALREPPQQDSEDALRRKYGEGDEGAVNAKPAQGLRQLVVPE